MRSHSGRGADIRPNSHAPKKKEKEITACPQTLPNHPTLHQCQHLQRTTDNEQATINGQKPNKDEQRNCMTVCERTPKNASDYHNRNTYCCWQDNGKTQSTMDLAAANANLICTVWLARTTPNYRATGQAAAGRNHGEENVLCSRQTFLLFVLLHPSVVQLNLVHVTLLSHTVYMATAHNG